MKKALFIGCISFIVISCGPSEGQGGVVDDGIEAVDKDGALTDTNTRPVDTLNPNRTDIQQRDTIRH
jgi:hypothetical protein